VNCDILGLDPKLISVAKVGRGKESKNQTRKKDAVGAKKGGETKMVSLVPLDIEVGVPRYAGIGWHRFSNGCSICTREPAHDVLYVVRGAQAGQC